MILKLTILIVLAKAGDSGMVQLVIEKRVGTEATKSMFGKFEQNTYLWRKYSEMIISFGNKETEHIWKGERVKRIPGEVQEIGRRKLRMLNNSRSTQDLMIPPSNRLEKLKANFRNFYSIRINDQWRVIFKWDNGNAYEVEIFDYH